MERRFEFIGSPRAVRKMCLTWIAVLAAVCLLGTDALQAQAPITFNYFYDDLGQLKKVVDSTGAAIDYVYDPVGNILQVNRNTVAPGALAIFNFTPQQGGPFTTVIIQGQGFSSSPTANIVLFNGTAARVVSATATNLVVTAPVGATTGPITVKVGSSTAISSNNFVSAPLPVISYINPKGALANSTVSISVTGVNLAGSTFSFLPTLVPQAITIASASINPSGTSATITATTNANTSGKFVLVATNAAGSSSGFPTVANSFSVVSASASGVDSDGDGLSDAVEILMGTDPFNPDTDGDGFSDGVEVASESDPLDAACTPLTCRVPGQEVDSIAFSVVNTVPPPGTFSEADSIVFSIINAVPAPGSFNEADSVLFSVLNSPSAPLISAALAPSTVPQKSTPAEALAAPVLGLRIIPSEAGRRFVEGQTITVVAEPKSGQEFAEVILSVNGVPVAADSSAPYEFTFTVPAAVNSVTFSASAKNSQGNIESSNELTIPVFIDPLSTITGRVVDSQGVPISAAKVEVLIDGLVAEFFDSRQPLTTLPDLTSLRPDLTKLLSAINVRNPEGVFGNDPFGVGLAPDYAARLSGWIRIAEPGEYRFILGADEGARLKLNGATVVDIPNGNGELQESSGTIVLSPGLVPIEVLYYEAVGKAELQLSYVPPGGERKVLPPELLSPLPAPVSFTNVAGEFSIPAIPTWIDKIRVRASPAVGSPDAVSGSVTPVPGGVASVGEIVIAKPR